MCSSLKGAHAPVEGRLGVKTWEKLVGWVCEPAMCVCVFV